MSTAYEELVERCSAELHNMGWDTTVDEIDIVLRKAFRTLEDVTPEMDRAASGALQSYINGLTDEERAESGARKKGGCFVGPKTKHRERYFAMLRASPLAPPKEGK